MFVLHLMSIKVAEKGKSTYAYISYHSLPQRVSIFHFLLKRPLQYFLQAGAFSTTLSIFMCLKMSLFCLYF